jgi:hypothetical protein
MKRSSPKTLKKTAVKILKPLSGFAAMIALGVPGANAQPPVFSYDFPASYNGTGSVITDQSTAGNNGTFDGTLTLAAAPPGGSGNSVVTTSGGILTGATASLNNATVAAAGGFIIDASFMWNGTDKTGNGHTQKIVDYSGTESLQLVTTAGSASLQMQYANNAGVETIANSTTILPGVWYNVQLTFDTIGNTVDGTGALTGTSILDVNGTPISSVTATKGDYGDGLSRPIGIGQLGANFGDLVAFTGDIYDPSVSLVPEPTSISLMGLGGLAMAWKLRRRKA